MSVSCPCRPVHVRITSVSYPPRSPGPNLSVSIILRQSKLCYVYTYTDWHTDVTRTNVRIMSLSTGSCSYHIRVISATVSRAKFVRVDYFETVKITDTDKCPYQIRIASVSCPPCIRVVLVTFVSHPWYFLARIHTRIWQGYDTDTTRTLYGCNKDERWPGWTNNHGRGFDTNVVRVWHGFDTDNANTTRMRHGRDMDSTRGASVTLVPLTTVL